jgi:hypothetical protein
MKYPNFQHHPDGLIFVRKSASEIYQDVISNFQTDYGSTYPGLPDGYIGRYYEPGVDHYLHTDNTAYPQDLSWDTGDAYIAAYDKLVAAKAAREAVNITS